MTMKEARPVKTIDARIRSMCAEGAATAADVTVELGLNHRIANAHLCNMHRKGQLTRARYYSEEVRRQVWIYSLAEPGRKAA